MAEVFFLHERVLAASGGAAGVRDLRAVEAAVAQPKATFGGEELYPTVIAKAATLCFSLVQGHPFIDGNKRVGHAAMEVFLMLNGYSLDAHVDVQERIMLSLASGALSRHELLAWLEQHVRRREPSV
ncbi:type II toxin-antitoxin system death-on-curing family toxin [Sorangium sp. So ce302]